MAYRDTEYRGDGSLCYDGEYVDGRRSGNGTEYRNDESVLYEGEFNDGFRHGRGKGYRVDGTLFYDGEWARGECNGRGKMFYGDGYTLKYDGDVQDGKPHGLGKEYSEDGRLLYDGEYMDGRLHGRGKMYRDDGTLLYEGEWKDGLPIHLQKGIFMMSGVHDEEATAKKRKVDSGMEKEERDRISRMHAESPYVSEVPTCVLCFGELHHGDASFVYVPCGHRALCGACEKTLTEEWRTKCPCCKVTVTRLLRVF